MAQQTLEDFALKGLDLGRLTGVSVAVHAIPDAFLLLHVGVGCKHKATTQLSTHDLSRGVVAREAWTEVGDAELIRGASDRLGPYIRSWATRTKPAFMAVCSATFLDLTGEDIAHEVDKAAKTVDCEVALVPAPGYSGDLFAGYADTLLAICKRIDWKQPKQRGTVAVIGQMFDRYEGDQTGNLSQIRTLLKGIGLTPGPILLSGMPYASLMAAGSCDVVVEMPYLAPVHKRLQRLIGKRRPTVVTDLPMGLSGSSRWLRQVAAAAGLPHGAVDRYVRGREEAARQALVPALGALSGQQVAVFADLPLAAGSCAALSDLGIEVVLVGLRGESLGGAAEFAQALERYGVAQPAEVLENPSLARVRQRVGALLSERRLDGVIGSATELNIIATLSPRSLLRQTVAGAVLPSGPFVLEIGFPCKRYHALRSEPSMGHAGMLTWAQRLIGAPRLWDAGRQ